MKSRESIIEFLSVGTEIMRRGQTFSSVYLAKIVLKQESTKTKTWATR